MRYPGEIQKLCNGDDWTDCKIQGYLSDGWDSNVLSIALISTPNLRNFATNQRKQLKEMQHRTNGIKIYAAFWEDLEINGYGLKKALSSWEIDENFHLPSKPQP